MTLLDEIFIYGLAMCLLLLVVVGTICGVVMAIKATIELLRK